MAFGLAPHYRDPASLRTRRRIAAGIESLIDDAQNRTHGMSSKAPMHPQLVLAAQPELQELVDHLAAEGVVDPRGVEMALALLTDASGPLYRADDPGALKRAAIEATRALENGRRF